MATMMRALARTLVKGECSYAREDETIRKAAERLSAENIGALPVYDRHNQLTGMLTDRDIVVNVVARGKDPSQTRVGEIIQGQPVTVDANAPVEEAMRLMAEHKIRRVPVTEAGTCIGMISQADIARTVPPAETGRIVALISTD